MAIRKIYTCGGKRGALIEVKRVHFARSGSQSEGRILPRLPTPGASHTAISRKVVKKKVHTTISKGIVGCFELF